MPASFPIAFGNQKHGLRRIDEPPAEEEPVCAVRIQANMLEGTAVPTAIAMQVTISSACMMQLLYSLGVEQSMHSASPLLHNCLPCVHTSLRKTQHVSRAIGQ